MGKKVEVEEVTVEEIVEFLKTLLNSIKGKEKQELTSKTDIMTDFGIDDIGVMEVTIELENEYNIHLNDKQIALISTSSSSRQERSPATPEAFTKLINESLTENK